MYTKSIIRTLCSLTAIAGLFISCEETTEELGEPSLEINPSELSFEKAGGTKTVSVIATRDWKASAEEEWISIQPDSGKASKDPVTVEISVLENTGVDREPGSVKFDIGFEPKILVVNQKGLGSAADRIVYSNNFDKEVATETYGTNGSSWPYLDQFEGWKNAEGTGSGSETYAFNAMSGRSDSNSNGSYSDYEGSGDNNLFFGTNAYFSVSGINLPAQTNYFISFGSEKYLSNGDSNFNHSEFHVYVSNDDNKWVELTYTFPSGDKEGRWDLATANFTLPSGTSTLSIYIKADVASAYRLDDLSLNISSEAGTAVDFSKGIEIKVDEESGSDDSSDPSNSSVVITPATAGVVDSLLSSFTTEEIISLTIKGHINAKDFNFIKMHCLNVENLDISETVIDEYTGDEGTNEGYDYTYAANEIPLGAFFYWVGANPNPPENIDTIYGDGGMPSLKTVKLPVGITAIRRNAFARAYNLVEINIPEGVESIDYVAFRYCVSLTEITLPSTIKGIGTMAFTAMSALNTVHCNAVIPPEITSSSFGTLYDSDWKGEYDASKDKFDKLYVPQGCRDAYVNAGWLDYFSEISEE